MKLETYNKIHGITERNYGTKVSADIKSCLHNIISRATLNYGSETQILN